MKTEIIISLAHAHFRTTTWDWTRNKKSKKSGKRNNLECPNTCFHPPQGSRSFAVLWLLFCWGECSDVAGELMALVREGGRRSCCDELKNFQELFKGFRLWCWEDFRSWLCSALGAETWWSFHTLSILLCPAGNLHQFVTSSWNIQSESQLVLLNT